MKHSTEAAKDSGMEASRAPTFPTKHKQEIDWTGHQNSLYIENI